jgi:hypothetical protein
MGLQSPLTDAMTVPDIAAYQKIFNPCDTMNNPAAEAAKNT